MRSNKNIQFEYNADTHTTLCKRKIHNKVYIGQARCHPSDYDFESTLMGQHYAYIRSLLNEMRSHRDDLSIELKLLNHIYNILQQNSNVSESSFECYTLRRQIMIKERDLSDIRALIKDTSDQLRSTINDKDKLYLKLREKRKTNK